QHRMYTVHLCKLLMTQADEPAISTRVRPPIWFSFHPHLEFTEFVPLSATKPHRRVSFHALLYSIHNILWKATGYEHLKDSHVNVSFDHQVTSCYGVH